MVLNSQRMHLKEKKLKVRVSCPLINAETRNRQFETIYLCLKGSGTKQRDRRYIEPQPLLAALVTGLISFRTFEYIEYNQISATFSSVIVLLLHITPFLWLFL